MREGQIVLTELLQATGTPKRRPALVLRQMPGYGDYLVCGLSSQLWQNVAGFDELLTPDGVNRLRVTSVIRLGFLDVVPETQIFGQIGRITPELQRELLQRLTDHLTTT